MPQILPNPYANDTSLGGTLAAAGNSLVDSLFGKDAANAAALRAHSGYYNAETAAVQQKTAALAEAASKYAAGDLPGAVSAYLRSGLNPETGVGGANLVTTANDPNIPITDPRISKAQIGAGKTAEATPWGVKTAEATKYGIAQMQTDRVLANEKYKFDNAPVPVQTPDGRVIQVPATQAHELFAKDGYSLSQPTVTAARIGADKTAATEKYKFDNAPVAVVDTDGNVSQVPAAQAHDLFAKGYQLFTPSVKVAQIQADKTAATQKWQDEHTFVQMLDPDGVIRNYPKSEVAARQAQGSRVQPTLDQTKANMLQSYLPGGSNAAGATSGSISTTSATPAVSPFANMPVGIRHAVGGLTDTVHYFDPQTRQVYQSDDGGETVDVAGQRVPVRGSRLQQITSDQALTQTQDNLTRNSIGDLPKPPTAQPQAAVDARTTSGLKSAFQHEANSVVGAFSGPEIGADTNRARDNLDLLVNDTRAALAGIGGRAAVQDKKWAEDVLVKPGWFGMTGANADEQYNKVLMFTQHLRKVYDAERAQALDPNMPPADRTKAAQSLRQLARVIQAWEQPVNAAKPAAASAAPATPNAPSVKQEPPAGAPPNARQAPDGNWYVPDPKRPGKYLLVQ